MTRLLALDWDQEGCRVLAGTLSRAAAQVERAVLWAEREPLTAEGAEELGRKLREFLKSSGIAAAPVVACVARERVLLKEIRYPAVSPREEPALVRFQAAKDLVEAADDVVLDYAPLPGTAPEARALVAILRRDILTSYQALCRAAGLKLQGLTVRSFAMPGWLNRGQKSGAIPASVSSAPSAVLALGPSRAELTIVRGPSVLFARSLERDSSLAGEVRRSLVIFSSQSGENRPQALYVLGEGGAELRDSLQAGSDMPVTVVRTADPTENFAAGVGLLEGWSKEAVPVNFARPKDAKAQGPADRRPWVLAGGATALVFLALVFLGMYLLANKRAEVQQLVEARVEVEATLKQFEQDRVDLEALKEWDRGALSWVDEFYDLTARLPQEVGFHLTKVQAEPLPRRTAKDKHSVRLNLTGITPPGKDALVHQFLDGLKDDHLLARIERFKGGSSQEFFLKVDLARQPAKDHVQRLILKTMTAGARP